jgi:hypothetical protein
MFAATVVWVGIALSLSNASPPGEGVESFRLLTAQKADDGTQYLSMSLSPGEEPHSIAVEIDVPAMWLIHVGATEIEGAFTISAYNFTVDLQVGDNIIAFTPKLAGKYEYTCKAGKGAIIVFDT